MHGVGDGVHEVHHAEEPHEAPALKVGVEGKVYDDARGKYADDEPGLELAPSRAGALDDVAHDGVVYRIEDPCGNHDSGNCGELCHGKGAGEQNVHHKEVDEEIVHHVPAHRAEREHDEVSLSGFHIVHEKHL